MWGDLYPHEVTILILTNSNMNIFCDHTREQEEKVGFADQNY